MKFFRCGMFAVSALAFSPCFANAGTIILEGSDAIGLHCTDGRDADACTYESQVWKALAGNSGAPIAGLGNPSPLGSEGSGITIHNFADVA
jgi:hypothetical protein